jgi:hypothetical protein
MPTNTRFRMSKRCLAAKTLLLTFVAGIAALIAACASMPRPTVDATPRDDATYFVIGLAPNSARFDLSSGTIRDGVFNAGILWIAHWYGPSDDGYLVIKADRNEALGIVQVQMMSSATSLIGPVFVPCARTLVFEAPAGKVVYLTHMTIRSTAGPNGPRLAPDFHQDMDGARAYMRARYPALADHLEQGRPQMMPVRGGAGGCR